MSKIKYSQIRNKIIKTLLKTAEKKGILVRQIDEDFATFSLQYKDQEHYIWGKRIGLNNKNSGLVSNKFLTNKLLKEAGVKVPQCFLCRSIEEVKDLIAKKKIKFPFVLKPFNYSLGLGVTAQITNVKMLNFALQQIKKVWAKSEKRGKRKRKIFLAEEYITGNDYRILVLNNQVKAVAMRQLPQIVGNGKNTIRELIIKYYQEKDKKPKIDKELKRNLQMQKVGLEKIIPKGKIVVLRRTANIHTGGTSINVTTKIHPYYQKIAVKACKKFGLKIAGVDLMTEDISKKSDDYAVIEINSLPCIAMHQNPDIGQPVPVYEMILKSIFPHLK